MKKKFVSFVLSICLVLSGMLVFTACGDDDDDKNPNVVYTAEQGVEVLNSAITASGTAFEDATKETVCGTASLTIGDGLFDIVFGMMGAATPDLTDYEALFDGSSPISFDITQNESQKTFISASCGEDFEIKVLHDDEDGTYFVLKAGTDSLYFHIAEIDEGPSQIETDAELDDEDEFSVMDLITLLGTPSVEYKDGEYIAQFSQNIDLIELIMGLMNDGGEGSIDVDTTLEGPGEPNIMQILSLLEPLFNEDIKLNLNASLIMKFDANKVLKSAQISVSLGIDASEIDDMETYFEETIFENVFDTNGKCNLLGIALNLQVKLNDAVTTTVPENITLPSGANWTEISDITEILTPLLAE